MHKRFQRLKGYWSWYDLNPLNWSTPVIKLFASLFFAIMLPVYLFIGFRPAIPAEAAAYPQLEISSIGLQTPVEPVQLQDRELIAPQSIAGIYQQSPNKLFIFGHSSSVFKKLNQVNISDLITYDGKAYRITAAQTLPKSDIDMAELLQSETKETIIIMTCAGTPLPNQDATHRLILTAILLAG